MTRGTLNPRGRLPGLMPAALVAGLALLVATVQASYIEEDGRAVPSQRPEPTTIVPIPLPRPRPVPSAHVPELARYLDRLEIRRPLVYGRLAVYPVVLRGGETLGGRWWALDAAIAKGVLTVSERGGGGSVPFVVMENRSRNDHVFVMAGEVVSGGKQTRTVRQDVLLAPGQQVEIPVFCVEAHRWEGQAGFRAGGLLVPQSIQREMRKGADQSTVWSEVARNNAALGAENRTGSLELGLKAAAVQKELGDVRRAIVPEVPADSVGFIFADRYAGRGLGAEFFGRSDLALALLPKLIDAYAVDFVVQMKEDRVRGGTHSDDVAREFLGRLWRAGSYRSETPGSGAGIRTRAAGLVGDGVSLGDALAHFGCQVEERHVPPPVPVPLPGPVPQPRGGMQGRPMVE